MGRHRSNTARGMHDERPGGPLPTTPGTLYRSTRTLTPDGVRRQRFSWTPLGRRGLSPDEVDDFLRQVEAELADLHREVVAARDEAERYRLALRQWCSSHARCHLRPDHPPATTANRPNWAALAVRQRDGRRTRG